MLNDFYRIPISGGLERYVREASPLLRSFCHLRCADFILSQRSGAMSIDLHSMGPEKCDLLASPDHFRVTMDHFWQFFWRKRKKRKKSAPRRLSIPPMKTFFGRISRFRVNVSELI